MIESVMPGNFLSFVPQAVKRKKKRTHLEFEAVSTHTFCLLHHHLLSRMLPNEVIVIQGEIVHHERQQFARKAEGRERLKEERERERERQELAEIRKRDSGVAVG